MRKVIVYAAIGRALDLLKFTTKYAVEKSGMSSEDWELIFITWKTSPEVYQWIKDNNYRYFDMEYDEGRGFLWNIYKSNNFGYETAFQFAKQAVVIGTDHCFYDNWLLNLYKHSGDNRMVTCKLIEPDFTNTIHTRGNFGVPIEGQFDFDGWNTFASQFYEQGRDKLVTDEVAYGRKLDSTPYMFSKDIWERFKPFAQTTDCGTTGDNDFFNRCRKGGVEIVKSLDSVVYHYGAGEFIRNVRDGIYAGY